MELEIVISEPVTTTERSRILVTLPQEALASCRVSTTIHGGYQALDLSLKSEVLSAGLLWNRPFCDVRVLVDGLTVFEGRNERWTQRGWWVTDFPAMGYRFTHLADYGFESQDTAIQTNGTILRNVLLEYAPLLKIDQEKFVDPGREHAPRDFHGMMVDAIVNQLVREGDDMDSLYSFCVWENRHVSFLPIIAPAWPDYVVSRYDARVERSPDYSGVYGEVQVYFTTDGINQHTDPKAWDTWQERYTIERHLHLQAGELTPKAADGFRDTTLRQRSSAIIPAQINLQNFDGLSNQYGQLISQQFIRAGQWVKVEYDDLPAPIVHTDWDVLTGAITIECGNVQRTFVMTMAELIYADYAARQKLDGVSGGRLR